jgi:acetoacetyl-CoA synthetase
VDITAPMFPRPAWFAQSTLNYAENILFPSPEITNPENTTAIICATEEGVRQRLTWSELRRQVAFAVQGFKQAGISKGDRVGGILGNTEHALISMLATAAIGVRCYI